MTENVKKLAQDALNGVDKFLCGKAALENKATVIPCIREKSLVIIRHFWIRWNDVCYKKKSLFFLEAILPAREINIYVRLIAPPRYDWILEYIFCFDRQTDTIWCFFRYARLLVSLRANILIDSEFH